MQKPYFESKSKIPRNKSKSNLQISHSCFPPQTSPKNTKYYRNETILKIGHHAKAIAHAKSSRCVKIENSQKKHIKIHSTNHLQKPFRKP